MKRQHRWQKSVILAVFLAVIVVMSGIYYFSTNVHSSARAQALKMAQTKGGIQNADFYSEFDRSKRYFAVGGQDQKHPSEYKYVIIDGQSGHLKKINGQKNQPDKAEKIVLHHQKPQKITRVALGYYHTKPVWEVTYKKHNKTLGYCMLNFKNTKIIQVIDNL
ncbi:hypothetical protein [Bombilactobacillus thymidiniphilus]|uniref:DUF5590 domain-containing protein n=1 Tax=Bombilactobacillus thymidiniphilus TaxID=2923363 RepID=A0ABY4PCS7_9LACO|nr:hypothetical protein [Bombilactobacillus thymidiniphilus]UQS83563.1 hypothetical protein MOO47_07290 [Bombilactobacillus thymidiniphilus]